MIQETALRRDFNGHVLTSGDEVAFLTGDDKLWRYVGEDHLNIRAARVSRVHDGVDESKDVDITRERLIRVRSWHDLATEAEGPVQSACNLLALVRELGEVIPEVRARLAHEGIKGNDALFHHHVVVLWVNKIESLTNATKCDVFHKACEWAEAQKKAVAS